MAASCDALLALLRGDLRHLEGERHVVGDGHVRVQRVVLEHHRDVAVLGRDVGDVAVTDEDLAAVDLLEPREHPQGRGLAASRGPDENHELAVADLEVDAGDRGLVVARVPPLCLVEGHCCHACPTPSPAGTCRTIRSEVTPVTLGVVSTRRARAGSEPPGSSRMGSATCARSVVRGVEQDLDRPPAHRGEGQGHRGQAWSQPRGQLGAVEGDDGDVVAAPPARARSAPGRRPSPPGR